jgi:hypothetical protein
VVKRIWSHNGFRLGLLMFCNYLMIAISFRMLAKASYVGVGITDALIAWWGFTMTQRIGQAQSMREQVGYTVGGICGSLAGLWLDLHVLGRL